MVKILWDRAREIGLQQAPRKALKPGQCLSDYAQKSMIIVVGRGSSDPNANTEFCRLVRFFTEETDITWVVPCFIGVTTPSMDDALELAGQLKPEHLFIVPYYLFKGVLVNRINQKARQFAETNPEISVQVSKVIGIDQNLFQLMDERVAEVFEEKAGREPALKR